MKTRLGSGLLVVALLLSLAPSTGNAAPTGLSAGTKPITSEGYETTLITGDKVRVAATGAMSITEGKGRNNIRFLTSRASGHLRVVPSDALPLLAAGRLDPRLFDLNALADFGDDKGSDLPLIVTGTAGAAGFAGARTALSTNGAKVVRDLPADNGLAIRIARDSTFWTGMTKGVGTLDSGIGKIWLDGGTQGQPVGTAGASMAQTPSVAEPESYDLTLTQTNREGQVPDVHETLIVRTDQPGFYELVSEEPTATVRLPKGSYTVHTVQVDFAEDPEAPPLLTFGVQPGLQLTANQNVVVDGRLSRPVSITLARPGLAEVFAHASATTITPDGPVSIGVAGHDINSVQTLALGQQRYVDGFYAHVASTRSHVTPEGRPDNSPVVYNLAWITKGRMVTGATHTVRDRDLATVVGRYAATQEGGFGEVSTWAIGPGPFDFPAARDLKFTLPFTRTEYFNTDGGARWLSLLLEEDAAGTAQSSVQQQPRVYRAGATYHEDWNRAVFGPAVGQPAEQALVTTRSGDLIHAFVPTHGDGAGRVGLANFATVRTALFKDGVKVGEVDDLIADFTVPASPGRYRLEVDLQRLPGPTLSTSVSGRWTFRSGHVGGTATLPLWTVTFSPSMNERNIAPAGRAFAIPVKAVSAPGSNAGRLRSLRVEVSFDGGATWRPAPIANDAVRISHPSGTGFVSLRAVARDTRDNAVEQTIINAYRFG